MSVAASNAAPAGPRQAVLLAAGRGSRTGTLSARRPKALLPLAGRSLLERSVEALCAVGIERLCLVGGWQLEALQAFIRQQAARRLAALAGQAPGMADIPRRRPESRDA